MIPVGIHYNLPPAVYYVRELGVASKSALDKLHKSPAHYRSWVEGVEEEPTPALVFGSALHCAVLEPSRFGDLYVFQPSDLGDGRTKEGRAKREAFAAEAAGRTVLTAADGARLQAMTRRLHVDRVLAELLADDAWQAEVTISWEDRETGILCKGRVDGLALTYGVALDLKSTEDASPQGFAKSVANFRYHVQAAMYQDGLKAHGVDVRKFVFAAIEKAPPFEGANYWLDQAAIDKGREAYQADLRTLADCIHNDEWPGYTGGELRLPAWAA